MYFTADRWIFFNFKYALIYENVETSTTFDY